jgi:hypothetical protein
MLYNLNMDEGMVNAMDSIKTEQKRRCTCGGGECVLCDNDRLDRLLIRKPDFRECKCGMSCCGTCNYYKSIGKFVPESLEDF